MSEIEKFKNIINSSKSYSMDGTKLTISDYYTGGSITIDLDKIDEKLLDDLIIG